MWMGVYQWSYVNGCIPVGVESKGWLGTVASSLCCHNVTQFIVFFCLKHVWLIRNYGKGLWKNILEGMDLISGVIGFQLTPGYRTFTYYTLGPIWKHGPGPVKHVINTVMRVIAPVCCSIIIAAVMWHLGTLTLVVFLFYWLKLKVDRILYVLSKCHDHMPHKTHYNISKFHGCCQSENKKNYIPEKLPFWRCKVVFWKQCCARVSSGTIHECWGKDSDPGSNSNLATSWKHCFWACHKPPVSHHKPLRMPATVWGKFKLTQGSF